MGSEHSQVTARRGRIAWIDAVRALAIIVVVLCHATEALAPLDAASAAAHGMAARLVSYALFTIGRLGVPLFLFMSGYLLLDRDYDAQACRRFWKTKWLPLLLVTEAWIVIYDVVLRVLGQPVTVSTVIENMLFFEDVGFTHFWYLPMIIGMYAFLPLISNGLRHVDTRTLALPVLFCFVAFLVLPTLGSFSELAGGEAFSATTFSSGFGGGTYGFYMLLGLLVRRGAFERVRTSMLIALAASSFALMMGMQVRALALGVTQKVWYSSALLAVCALCLFVPVSRVGRPVAGRLVGALSKYSFAVFLVHAPVYAAIVPYVAALPLALPHAAVVILVRVALLFAATLAISLCVSAAIARIPVVGRRLLYMR